MLKEILLNILVDREFLFLFLVWKIFIYKFEDWDFLKNNKQIRFD